MPIDARRRANELELLAVRLEELQDECKAIAGLENVAAWLLIVRIQVVQIARELLIFERTGPDNFIDPECRGV